MRCQRFIAAITTALVCCGAHAAAPVIGGCSVLPGDNPWNTLISNAAVDANSARYIANINANGGDFVHPDFGSDPSYGIPWTTVGAGQAPVPVSFDVPEESDAGPYPIPADAPMEGGSDHHVLVVDTSTCILYELYAATYSGSDSSGWDAFSGAVWPLDSNKLRPNKWTSADAAGLPILPGLARCDEANSGQINHALRFTVNRTRKAYRYPASHQASSYTATDVPAMGLRLRLQASYDTSLLDGQAGAIAQALKTYGMILADNGSNWFISGETNPACWNDDDLNRLKAIPGSAFEVIASPPPPSTIAGDLLANGGFEAGVLVGSRPGFWTVTGSVERICNDPQRNFVFASAGQCAARIAAGASGVSRLSQILQDPPAGTLRLRLRARFKDMPAGGASATALVSYGDATQQLFSFALPSGTSTAYQSYLFNFSPNPNKIVAKVTIRVNHVAASGQLRVDQLALVSGL